MSSQVGSFAHSLLTLRQYSAAYRSTASSSEIGADLTRYNFVTGAGATGETWTMVQIA
jgi:hypothetical protein